MSIECLKYKSYSNGALMGFADFYVEKMGLEIYGCSIFQKNGKRWISFPSKEYKNEQNETKWAPSLRFRQREHMDAFSASALKALDEWCLANPQQEEPQQATYQPQEVQDPNSGIPF